MRRALVHATYLALSLLFAGRFFSLTHPTSFAITEGDPALMCWTLQWESHALVHDPAHVLAGNTFYPYPHSVLLSDSMLPLAIANVPVRLLTSNPWAGYDMLVLLSYYLSCLWGAWFVRELTESDAAAFWGGVFWGFLFFRVHHIGHLQLLSFQFIPAAAAALLRFWRRPGWRSAITFAVLFVAQALVSWYLAVVMAVVLLVIALCQRARETLSAQALKWYPIVVVICAAAIVPVASAYRAAFADSTLAERQSLVDTFGDAVHLGDYLTPPVPTLAGQFIRGNKYWIWGENTLYVGFVPLLLSAAAVVRSKRPDRRWILTGIALIAAGYIFALGFVSPSLGIRLPLHYLARAMPMLAGVRATQRFSVVIYFGVLILSSMGMRAILSASPVRRHAVWCAVICAAFLIEVFPFTLPVHADNAYAVSAPDRLIAVYQRSRTTPLVVLHVPINYFREPYPVSEAIYMLDSTAHWARILNGFSGGVPNGFMDRMATLNTLPSPPAVQILRDLGVDVIAVHRGAANADAMRDFFDRQSWASVSSLPDGEFVVLIDRAKKASG